MFSTTRYEWTVADFAIWFAGGVTVPVYETSSPSQIEWILRDSGARHVIVENAARAAVLNGAIAESEQLRQAVFNSWQIDDDGGAATLETLARLGTGVTDAELERSRATASLVDPASIVYTSGTTGQPKGCVITHGNFALMGKNTAPYMPELFALRGSRTLMFLPLAHVLARAVQLAALVAGTTLGHTSSAAELLEDMDSYKPTFLLCIPRIYEKILATARASATSPTSRRIFAEAEKTAVELSQIMDRQSRGEQVEVSRTLAVKHRIFDMLVYRKIRAVFGGRLRHTVSGASKLGDHEAHFFRGAGIMVQEGYGLTESTAPVTVNTAAATRIGSVGKAMPGTQIRIADDGEVQVKGIGMFACYHNNVEATREAFTEGYFRTGDLGLLDADGYLTITGRKKDLLVTAGGKNVAPGPLEHILRESPLVSNAVVLGEGKPFIAALLTLDEDGLRAFATAHGLDSLTAAQASAREDVRAEIQTVVDRANQSVSKAESIRKFTVLTQELSVEAGQLTPSLKVKRAAVLAEFAEQIDTLYAK